MKQLEIVKRLGEIDEDVCGIINDHSSKTLVEEIEKFTDRLITARDKIVNLRADIKYGKHD